MLAITGKEWYYYKVSLVSKFKSGSTPTLFVEHFEFLKIKDVCE